MDDTVARAGLDRILASPTFAGTKRLQQFLAFIVDETLAGRGDALKEFTIATEVYGRDASFDPRTDTLVRVEAGRLRRRLESYYLKEGRGDAIRFSIPKGRYVPAVQFDEPEPDANAEAAAPAVSDRGPSIAVLPFENYGPNSDDQFFADGLTEETIANLARFKDLFVFSRSTMATLYADGVNIRELHKDLGVTFVLEGSVRRSASKVRVTLQLIDAASDGHIYADQFERDCTPEGVFEIQDEIARLVAGRVADRHGPLGRYVARAARGSQSIRWDSYLWVTRFYEYYATHRPDLHLEVRDGLVKALVDDADYSDGWAALAAVLLDEYRFHLNERPGIQALDQALEAALRSVACDPDNAMAYQFLACIRFHRHEHAEFDTAAQRALALNSGHAGLLADIGHCYACSGRWNEGLALIEHALEISPIHPGWYHMAPACRKLLDDEPMAAVAELKTVPMPGFYWYHALLACFFAWADKGSEAATEVSALTEVFPVFGERASEEFGIWSDDDELVSKVMDGWQKAGILTV